MRGVQDNFFRLFSILLDNAIKYCDLEGVIFFCLDQKGKNVCLSVSNPCVDVDASQLSRYFDRFYRADPSRNRSTGGSGIGLLQGTQHGRVRDRPLYRKGHCHPAQGAYFKPLCTRRHHVLCNDPAGFEKRKTALTKGGVFIALGETVPGIVRRKGLRAPEGSTPFLKKPAKGEMLQKEGRRRMLPAALMKSCGQKERAGEAAASRERPKGRGHRAPVLVAGRFVPCCHKITGSCSCMYRKTPKAALSFGRGEGFGF